VLRERERFVNDPDFSMIRRGNFFPKDGIIGNPIMWEDDEMKGRWEVSKFLDKKDANKFEVVHRTAGDIFKPLNDEGFSAGFDPTKTHNNPENVRSFAGGAIQEKAQFWNPLATPNFVADYVWKPDDPEQAYLDMLYGCMYYGCSFLPENNLGISSVLRRNGCEDFIMSRPEITYKDERKARAEDLGIAASNTSNDQLLKKKKTWMFSFAPRLIHPRIIRTSISFDPAKRTKFDLEVATQLAIMAAEKVIHTKKKAVDLKDIFGSFDNRSSYGKMN
jgi:hypothetical protein